MPIVPTNSIVKTVETGSEQSVQLIFAWNKYQAYSDEEYKTNPEIYFHQEAISYYGWKMSEYCEEVDLSSVSVTYGNRAVISIESVIRSGQLMVYTDPGLTLSRIGTFTGEAGQTQEDWGDIEYEPYTNYANLPAKILGYKDNRVSANSFYWYISTNIPIFETDADASEYMQYGDNIQNAINNNVPSVEGRAFEIINLWTEGTWSPYGYTPASGAEIHHRDVRGRIPEGGSIAMYPVQGISDGGLIYNVVIGGELLNLEYSEDGVTWIPTDNFPYNYFYRQRVDEIGTFKFALTYYTDRVPVFEDEDTAQGYIDGDIDISEALNWPDISNNYPGGDTVPTGEPDDGTDWGDVYTQNFFANTYLISEAGLSEIANALYDTGAQGTWENIKKGIEMFGQNPMDAFISLIYYPLDLSTVFTNISSTGNIWFGGYNFSMTNHPYQLVYPNGYYYCGGIDFVPKFKNWRDTKAMRVFVDLPYCGRYELDPSKYWGKHINVIYYIDLTTGGCICCLVEGAAEATREGKCLDQFNGQIGTKISMTLTDFSRYANAQINTLLGGGGQAISSGSNFADTGINAAATGSAIGIAGSLGGAALMGGIHAANTVYGLSMNNINKFNQTRGGSTGMLNQYANQKPTFIFIYPELDIPDNFNKMYGTPSNYGGTVSSFTGYLEVDTIKLKMDGATESEKAKARNLLMAGIYINT